MPQKLIIGLVGPMVSGKGTVADYLKENYNATVYGFSSPLRDIIKRLHLPLLRKNLANLSNCLRTQFGNDLISCAIMADIADDSSPLIVLDGIRRLSDIENASKLPGFILIKIDAKEQTRYNRLLKRSQNSDDQLKTLAAFQADEQAEADREIPLVMTKATLAIDNNGDFDSLYTQIDALIKPLLSNVFRHSINNPNR
ncbi:hypothetical protein COT94_04385 [Candidatus Falkowbacteria bacterium CG10_big_fil_rev_8_21_14_0_10_37_14]|uniref:Dephospho-CoA kinase n=1 Tax=Candidatus Falkowbacteria bacterium CG10_big_fil_rev_8_21_14_0_10_37_14 TaxID=1974561 RepID=A0A2M6WSN9_9BACT|nr:AAA family ATPase [Candidatus Falkowbacteria bacterium]PIT95794.1 MAG: hypothetical protein COT94_04385 [Candidatus Falkowbacteria bacterium CG10_big_fil_rev_8_21_14_0_10_37_14]